MPRKIVLREQLKRFLKKISVSKMNEATKKPNSYTSEFKESAVKLAIESDQPIAVTARVLGINVNMLHTWIGKYSKPKPTVAKRSGEHIYDESRLPKKERGRVTQERALLKKAIAYFAREIL